VVVKLKDKELRIKAKGKRIKVEGKRLNFQGSAKPPAELDSSALESRLFEPCRWPEKRRVKSKMKLL